jgi:hypothetical protein
LFTE